MSRQIISYNIVILIPIYRVKIQRTFSNVKDLGNLIEAYQEVARRLDILHEQSNVRPLKFPKPKEVKIKKK